MKTKKNKENASPLIEKDTNIFPDYPIYPPSDDIYTNDKEVDLNPEELSNMKKVNEMPDRFYN